MKRLTKTILLSAAAMASNNASHSKSVPLLLRLQQSASFIHSNFLHLLPQTAVSLLTCCARSWSSNVTRGCSYPGFWPCLTSHPKQSSPWKIGNWGTSREKRDVMWVENIQIKMNDTHFKYLTDGEHRVVCFSHGVVDEHGHQFSDFVQISCPGFLGAKKTSVKKKK